MWYRSLKLYHWIAIGFLVGVVVGVSRSMSGEEPALGGPGFVSQGLFIRAIDTPQINGKPYVKSVAVRPSRAVDGIDVVSFEALDTESDSYRTFLFAAPRPFVVGAAAPSDAYSVWDYLLEKTASNPALAPHAAWWEQTPAVLGFYALLGVVLIGGAWPAFLRLTGGPPPIESDYDLDRFHPEAAPDKGTPRVVDGDAHLHELEEELEHAMHTPAAEGTPVQSAPIRSLETQAYVPAAPLDDQAAKDFAGEFYPVEKHAPHGFSLVELVIVIGIIALLISFLMPSIQIARRAAEQAKCASNLDQIGIALHQYANTNHDWFPAWSNWHTWPAGSSNDSYGAAWTVEMIPYLGNPDSPIYNCPSFPRADHYRNYFLESQWSGVSGRDAMKRSDIKLSSMFVLSGDKTNMFLYPADVRQDDTDPDDFGGGGCLLWPWNGGFYMHRTGNNVLFDDGHVALYSRFDPRSMTFNPHRVEDHDKVTAD